MHRIEEIVAKTKRPAKSTQSKSTVPSSAKLAEIDLKLLQLLAARAALVSAEPSSAGPSSVADAQRSMREFIGKQKLPTPLMQAAIESAMQHVVTTCFASLPQSHVVYLGPEDSYSHLAAIKYFGPVPGLAPVASIAAVFEALVRNEARAGVVPIENSTDGRVVDTLGMFLKHRVRIGGELLLPIHHNLLSRTARAEITEVYSKPQALSQCRAWLAQNLPAAKLVEMSSTTAAAQLAADRHGAAAVASLEAASRYGLNVINANIEDNRNNVTRFAILCNEPTSPTGNDKTALLFQVEHQPGALADAMNLFKKGGLNLTWIESFPLPGSTNEYLFFVALEGHESEPQVVKTIHTLSKRTQRLEILGSYPKSIR